MSCSHLVQRRETVFLKGHKRWAMKGEFSCLLTCEKRSFKEVQLNLNILPRQLVVFVCPILHCRSSIFVHLVAKTLLQALPAVGAGGLGLPNLPYFSPSLQARLPPGDEFSCNLGK